MSESIFQEAVGLHRQGELALAEAAYQRVIAENEFHDRAWFLRGSVLHAVGQSEPGVLHLQRAVELAPHVAAYHAALGDAYRQSGESSRMLASFERAAHLAPLDANLQLLCGRALQEAGEPLRATGHLQVALLLASDTREPRERLRAVRAQRATKESNLARALDQKGDKTSTSERRGLKVRSSRAVEHAFQQATVLHRAGKLKDAEERYRKLLKLEPNHAQGLFWFGSLALETGRLPFAIDQLSRAATLQPDDAATYSNLGEAYARAGHNAQAIAAFQRALALEPEVSERHFNLAQSYAQAGEPERAIEGFESACDLAPGNARFQLELARALLDQGQLTRSIGHFQASLATAQDPNVWLELAVALRGLQSFEAALGGAARSLELLPDNQHALHLQGKIESDLKRLDAGIASFERALARGPAVPGLHADLGLALLGVGRVEEAVSHWEAAVLEDPNDVASDSNRVFALAFCTGRDDQAIASAARSWAARHEAPLAAQVTAHDKDRAPNKKLRVGYVCSVFREHALVFFILPLVLERAREQIEVYCYSGVTEPDAITAQLRASADAWRDVAALSDDELAAMIRADGIDVLVDLNMHMATPRLLTFARRPAPVQLTWAYPGTTGLSQMDYRITDRYLDPPGQALPYTETSIVLPDSYWCYSPAGATPKVTPLPALETGQVCFGNLNGVWKLNREVAALWAKILHAVPGSSLVLLSPGWQVGARGALVQSEQRIVKFFVDAGLAESRVRFLPRAPRQKYLAYYQHIDIGLDTLPYAGHTTSFDSFWMGVPVVSLLGDTVVGRAAATLTSNLGLPELLTRSEPELVTRAVSLAQDLPTLAALRAGLRNRLQGSRLMDGPRFARNMERAYRSAWQRYAAGLAPERIDLPID